MTSRFFCRNFVTEDEMPAGAILALKSTRFGLVFFREFFPPCLTGICRINDDFVFIFTVPDGIR